MLLLAYATEGPATRHSTTNESDAETVPGNWGLQLSVIERAASAVAVIVGPNMPARDARVIGDAVGDTVGSLVVGEMVGELVGELVGAMVGSELIGARVGFAVGARVGLAVIGEDVGGRVGPELDGARVGATVCTQTASTSPPQSTVRVKPSGQTAQAAHSPNGLCRHCRRCFDT